MTQQPTQAPLVAEDLAKILEHYKWKSDATSHLICTLVRQLEQDERRIEWLQERGVEELRGDVKLAREQRDIYARQWGQAEREKERATEAIEAALDVLHDPTQTWLPAAEILSVALTKPSGEVGEEA